jgi:hypothetical protein
MTNSKKNRSFIRLIVIIILSVTCILAIGYSFFALSAPKKTLSQMNQRFSPSQPLSEEFNTDSIIRLRKEKAILESRLKMAKSDSVCMTINLQDSSISLEIRGVTVRKSKIIDYTISKLFYKIDKNALIQIMSSPSKVIGFQSTIPKEDIIYKKAPKDTLEANSNIDKPDTTDLSKVFYVLYLNNGIRLKMNQSFEQGLHDKIPYLRFRAHDNMVYAREVFKSMFSFQTPLYNPWIEITLSRSDAKTIFRSIPRESMVTINL